MAFYVAQMQKQSETTYMTPIVQSIEEVISSSPNPFRDATIAGDEDSFPDFALKGNFQMGKVYYLRFKIHKVPLYYYSGQSTLSIDAYPQADVLNFRLLLKNQSQIDEASFPPEQIGTFTVPKALPNEMDSYASYSFIFTPSKKFDRLVFRLSRTGFDVLVDNRNWLAEQTYSNFNPENIINVQPRYINKNTEYIINKDTENEKKGIDVKGVRINYGQIEPFEDGDFCTLNNIIPQGMKNWIKIGYQSRPGSLIVVNGEPIRVGRSGIYELNNGTKIESFMIASPNGSDNEKIDAFLLDYAYNSTSVKV